MTKGYLDDLDACERIKMKLTSEKGSRDVLQAVLFRKRFGVGFIGCRCDYKFPLALTFCNI
jgi:hypothetical protein